MATITITTTAAQDARLAPAYGRLLGTVDANGQPRNATVAEVRAAIVQHLRDTVLTYETRRALETAAIPPFEPT